jgi:hypothetical protein
VDVSGAAAARTTAEMGSAATAAEVSSAATSAAVSTAATGVSPATRFARGHRIDRAGECHD